MVYIRHMQLKDFFISMTAEQRDDFARRCGTTLGQVRNVAYGRNCGEALAISIERESNGVIRCEDLRPDVDWAYLRGTDCAAKSRAA
jgi:DNA-binding transcriptional regulator YdaS (Cro superfamily)